MTTHRYPHSAIVADYVRASAGIILTLAPLAAVPVTTIAGSVLSVLAALFFLFAARTWIRSRTSVALSEEGLEISGLRHKMIPWQGVTSLELRYFATKRDRSQGWMQLTLKSAKVTIKLESNLEGFEKIVRAAAHTATLRGLSLSSSTIENLRSLELPADQLRNEQAAVN